MGGLLGGPGFGDRDIGMGADALTFPFRGSLQVQGHQLGGRIQYEALLIKVPDVERLGASVAENRCPGITALDALEGDGLCGE